MKEQNEKEKEKKKVRMNSEKKFYLWTAIGCALAMLAIVVVAVAVSGGAGVQQQGGVNSSPNSSIVVPNDSSSSSPSGGNQGDVGNSGDDNQTVVKPEGMVLPVESASVLNEYGFYHNQTLNTYYEHEGVDFAAEAGANVLCVDDGVVESIYKDDLLLGTEIVVDHGEGLKSVYRFVTEAENLTVGASVEKGQVIATVAEANGNEYKDGAHLHFEMKKDGVCVDPAVYLTLEEK
ncbi:MAG: M23 family metallopeptidase [Clostridia bacterium]|nr:M23 family metallopeptidase [Clostridia bacterium]